MSFLFHVKHVKILWPEIAITEGASSSRCWSHIFLKTFKSRINLPFRFYYQ